MSDYLHGHHVSVLRSHRRRTAANSAAYLLPHLRPGQRLLDVGAGPATITADLAEIVGPQGVVALEVSESALEVTRAGLAERGLTQVGLQVGDAQALPFADSSFDVVHAHQVLQHLGDPVQALRELARVTRRGGVVATRDSDYGGFTWHPATPALDTWLEHYQRLARGLGAEPDAGRHYRAWARAAGLSDVTITTSVWTYADVESVRWWGGLWAERSLASDFATRALALGVEPTVLESIAAGWRAWAADPDALFTVPSTELLARPG